jgi:hypothetical protein
VTRHVHRAEAEFKFRPSERRAKPSCAGMRLVLIWYEHQHQHEYGHGLRTIRSGFTGIIEVA